MSVYLYKKRPSNLPVVVQFESQARGGWEFPVFQFLPALCVVAFSNFSHSDGEEVVSHCDFELAFPSWLPRSYWPFVCLPF